MADSGRGYGVVGDYEARYNTPLSEDEDKQFKQWIEKNSKIRGYDLSKNLTDYDLQGWWKASGAKNAPDLKADGAHFTDEFKKPNHPTFSKESKYDETGDAGEWQKTDAGWKFIAGPANLKNYSADDLTKYFREVEPDAQLILPQSPSADGQ